MKVECIKLLELSGPQRGEQVSCNPHLTIGSTFLVLSLHLDPRAPSPWALALQIDDVPGSPSWWPAEMFRTIDSTIPANWIICVRDGGSLHLAPAAWLEEGFWSAFFDRKPGAIETYRRELAVISADAE